MCFPVNFRNFYKNTFFTEHVRATASRLTTLRTSHFLQFAFSLSDARSILIMLAKETFSGVL